MLNQTKRVALDGTTPSSKPDMTLGSLLSVALSSIPEKHGYDTIIILFRQPPAGALRFPFSGGLISRLRRSNFPRLAVSLPFWNGVNSRGLLIFLLPAEMLCGKLKKTIRSMRGETV